MKLLKPLGGLVFALATPATPRLGAQQQLGGGGGKGLDKQAHVFFVSCSGTLFSQQRWVPSDPVAKQFWERAISASGTGEPLWVGIFCHLSWSVPSLFLLHFLQFLQLGHIKLLTVGFRMGGKMPGVSCPSNNRSRFLSYGCG